MVEMSEFDEETLRIAKAYYGGDPRKPRTMVIEVFSEIAETSWPVADFLDQITKGIERIPPEYREAATVELVGDYDECSRLALKYSRPETEQEIAARVAAALAYAKSKQAQERATYEALKRKFEE